MDMKVSAIILAAGQGKRMNSTVAKQFLMLEDRPVLYYSIKAFEESCVDEIVLVCGHNQVDYCIQNIIKPYGFQKIKMVLEGGTERYDSVGNGIRAIENTDYLLIHDGARPFVSPSLINEVVEVVKESKACIVATPVKDTIKIVDRDGLIKATPSRELMWSAQTPQAFEYSLIRRAYEQLFQEDSYNRTNITDDAMVYERFINLPIKIVKGDYYNIKLTTPEDLMFAQGINNMLR